MVRRSGFSRPRSSGVARDWGVGCGGTSLLTVAASEVNVLGSGVQTVGSELTLLRTRGEFLISLTSATSAGHGFTGAVGIGVFSDQAFTAGVASMPSPVAEAFSNAWLWHLYFSVIAGEAGGLAGGIEGAVRSAIDSKAMRKFDSNQVMACIVETTEIGTATAIIRMDSRILFQDSGR